MQRATITWMSVAALLLIGCDQGTPEDDDESSAAPPAKQPRVEAPPWHTDLTFEQACEKAGKEGKTVFVEFYSDGCRCCQKVEGGVLKRDDVRQLLERHAVPIRVKLTATEALARRYRIAGAPTLLFLQPAGTEIERIVGDVSHEAFMRWAPDFVAGRDQLDQAQQKVERAAAALDAARRKDAKAAASAHDELVLAQHNLARQLLTKQRYDEALETYGEVLDACGDSDVLLTWTYPQAAAELTLLAGESASAKAVLDQRYDAARDRVRAGEGTVQDIWLLDGVFLAKDEIDRFLALYDRYAPEHSDPAVVGAWTMALRGPLVAAKRYQDVADRLDLKKAIVTIFRTYAAVAPQPEDLQSEEQWAQVRSAFQQTFVSAVSEYCQVLIATGQDDVASKVAERLVERCPGARTLNELAWAGYLTGRPTEANVAQAREADRLMQGVDAAITDTLARVLAARGQMDEAHAVLQKALARTFNDRDKAILQQCQADIEQGR